MNTRFEGHEPLFSIVLQLVYASGVDSHLNEASGVFCDSEWCLNCCHFHCS